MRNLLCLALLSLSASLICAAQDSSKNSNASRLQDAAQAITAGKLDRAESELQAVLRSAPGEYRALDLLGVVRVLQQHQTEAADLFKHAVEKKPDFAPAHAHLGLLYAQTNRPGDATPELREALRLDAGRTDASDALVHLLRDQARQADIAGDPARALSSLMEARKYASDNPDVQFEFGMVALQMSLFEDAVVSFQRTLTLREDDPIALYDLGRAFMALSNFESASQQFARYVKLRPDDSAGYCALGMTHAALQHPEEARRQFERSIALAPEQTESYYRLGLLDLDSKELDAAARNFRHALEREPKRADALTALGRVAFEQKQYPEAADLLQRAIANDDTLREAHYYLGLTLARMGRKQESDQQLRIATELEHDEAEHRRTVIRIADPTGGGTEESHQK